jgi:hypothetical protein
LSIITIVEDEDQKQFVKQQIIGSRSDAELQARALIDSWLTKPRKLLRA